MPKVGIYILSLIYNNNGFTTAKIGLYYCYLLNSEDLGKLFMKPHQGLTTFGESALSIVFHIHTKLFY